MSRKFQVLLLHEDIPFKGIAERDRVLLAPFYPIGGTLF